MASAFEGNIEAAGLSFHPGQNSSAHVGRLTLSLSAMNCEHSPSRIRLPSR